MGEELQVQPLQFEGAWQFIPSHLTKGLIAAGAAVLCAAYAVYEFKQVEAEEVVAMITGH